MLSKICISSEQKAFCNNKNLAYNDAQASKEMLYTSKYLHQNKWNPSNSEKGKEIDKQNNASNKREWKEWNIF